MLFAVFYFNAKIDIKGEFTRNYHLFLSLIFSRYLLDIHENGSNDADHKARARVHSLTGAGVCNQPSESDYSVWVFPSACHRLYKHFTGPVHDIQFKCAVHIE